MIKDLNNLLNEYDKLIGALNNQLNDSKGIIESIKKGNIDAVLLVNNKNAKVLVSETLDQTYRVFIENMTEGVTTLHHDGTLLYCNSSFAKMISLPLEQVIGKNIMNFIPLKHKKSFKPFLDNEGGTNSKVELSILDHKGILSYFIVSLNKMAFNNLVTLNLVFTDITEQKIKEEALKAANKDLITSIDDRTITEQNLVAVNNKLKEDINILKNTNIELPAFEHNTSQNTQEPL